MRKIKNGFTLIETLIGIALFAIVAVSVYFSYLNILNIIAVSQFNMTALVILNNEMEAVRNLPYEEVGIQGGLPAGRLLAEKTVQQSGAPFLVKTTVRNVDDVFDGTAGGTPGDLAPADYKTVEIEVGCVSCLQFASVRGTTTVAPRHLEGETNNGSLFINVFNASGQPVSGASVTVVNATVSPSVNVQDVTGTDGMLRLIDVPPSVSSYQITVSRVGYSSERTYLVGAPANPNPLKPHATVARQEVTNISFAIDRLSTISFRTVDQFCRGVPNIDFQQTGSKLIGTEPDVLKYFFVGFTDANGLKTIGNLEWDAYQFGNLDVDYAPAGLFSLPPYLIDPALSYSLEWLMESKNSDSLLVSVNDAGSQPVNDAKIILNKTGFQQILYTGQKTLTETDWSPDRYDSQSGKVDVNNPTGAINLLSINGKYASQSQEWLISKTVDFGTSDIVFYALDWTPDNQPPSAGADSFMLQIATNNDNSNWNFVGPDGTGGSYYKTGGAAMAPVHSGHRYLRYKVFLRTEDHFVTPSLEELKIVFHSSCIPDGQVFFTGLTPDTYSLTVEKAGYQLFTDPALLVDSDWREYRAVISP